MGYSSALIAAGAEVLDFETFGDYQGTWIAEVNYNGQHGFVVGAYGSCSHCDAFEAEFDSAYDDETDYQEKLKRFGESYLNHILTLDDLKRDYAKYVVEDWDWEGKAIVEWIGKKDD
jgi:hypothetical protein